MPSLKDLKVRINSTKNTQKITSAMKMVSPLRSRSTRGLPFDCTYATGVASNIF